MGHINRLSPAAVRNAKPGMHNDGLGLYLQVTLGKDGLSRSWIFRYAGADGKEHKMGLGSLDVVGLAEAREKAAACRLLRDKGVDPITDRDAKRAAAKVETTKATTFKQAAEAYVASHEAGWRSHRHHEQWVSTLRDFVYPRFGDLPVAAVDTGLVLRVVEPMWTVKPVTADRVRGRIEAVLNWAKARGLREGENPARWRGHIANLLPARTKVRSVEHHAALPYTEIGSFMAALRAQDGTAARALEFCILTATRTGEVHGMKWSEVDFEGRTWCIPGDRMKGGKDHRVPLGARAMAIIETMHAIRTADLVFPGRGERPMNRGALRLVLRAMGRDEMVHGFRSTFRDWAAETTGFPNHVVEMALAHAVGDNVEAAYRRGDLFEKRRKLMLAWAAHCNQPADDAKIVRPQFGGRS